MHNFHTDNVRFWANGDPYPSEVLMAFKGMDERFRTTTEDILAFLAALTLDALPVSPSSPVTTLSLKSTAFELNRQAETVLLRRLAVVAIDEIDFITVPLQDLKDYARQAIHRHLAYRLDDETLLHDSLIFSLFMAAQQQRGA